mmetsp:Transcript_22604/g.33054  ORF Transcript_22604/g.33054 Transcript_22604/m.33054 type:complete len:821 (+) Transcript_22604:110-2572(+)|eukprot:CAMPEP_0185030040 /NCGR_PEP_ID=MMETSP1103-20130426/16763_1 /TAXON_ID=36769 /ORGANISM="Paraphysomonas bandaiensis, Strain Caron Lab Isolate" /LENGTH=820 /DNA_ID=CAMNT_0027565005 /DNA_START=41 /DNA_END=2503 /DNA_ORIENTATION=-
MIRRRVASALSRHCYGLSAHTHRYAHRLHPLHSTSPLYFTVRAFSSSQQNNTNKDPSLSPVQKKGEGGKKKIDYKKKAWDAAVTVGNLTKRLAVSSYDFVRHPTQIPSKLRNMWQAVKDEAHHYWVGSKLLWVEVKTATEIMSRVLKGHHMTRRERLQLLRTTQDLVRLVPFSVFVVVPFLEFLLPLAIKIFPNMLPSTFEDSLKKEEALKKELAMRLGVATFFIETFQSMAEKKKKASNSDEVASASELIQFMEKAKMGEVLPNEAVLRISRLFKDELTLGNVSRPQLVTMCQFMGLAPYGTDAFLRFQLRTKITSIKEDDKRILWEGVESLTSQELRDACQERGMRATGLNTFGYRKQIREWLDLSMQKQIPISLLIMSRAFVLKTTEANIAKYTAEDTLRTSLSALDDDIINEVIVDSALAGENTAEIKKRKLESIIHQNELIREEREDSAEAQKREEEEKQRREKADIVVPVAHTALPDGETEQSAGSRLVGAIHPGDTVPQPTVEVEGPDQLSLAEVVQQEKEFGEDKGVVEVEATSPVRPPSAAPGSSKESEVDAVNAVPVSPGDKEKEADAPAAEKPCRPLSVAELQALSDLTHISAVEREKLQLAVLKEMIGSLESEYEADLDMAEATRRSQDDVSDSIQREKQSASDYMSSSPPEDGKEEYASEQDVEEVEDESEDPSMTRMKSALNGMMKKLEYHITQTENALGDKLQRLDKDRDGVLNSEELTDAVVKVLRKHSGSDEAHELVKLLDKDNDGKVSVQELLDYVESRKNMAEGEVFEREKPKDYEYDGDSKSKTSGSSGNMEITVDSTKP